MSGTVPKSLPCSIPGCHGRREAEPGSRTFHGDPEAVYNDAPSEAQLVRGDTLHDGLAVYRWDGTAWVFEAARATGRATAPRGTARATAGGQTRVITPRIPAPREGTAPH